MGAGPSNPELDVREYDAKAKSVFTNHVIIGTLLRMLPPGRILELRLVNPTINYLGARIHQFVGAKVCTFHSKQDMDKFLKMMGWRNGATTPFVSFVLYVDTIPPDQLHLFTIKMQNQVTKLVIKFYHGLRAGDPNPRQTREKAIHLLSHLYQNLKELELSINDYGDDLSEWDLSRLPARFPTLRQFKYSYVRSAYFMSLHQPPQGVQAHIQRFFASFDGYSVNRSESFFTYIIGNSPRLAHVIVVNGIDNIQMERLPALCCRRRPQLAMTFKQRVTPFCEVCATFLGELIRLGYNGLRHFEFVLVLNGVREYRPDVELFNTFVQLQAQTLELLSIRVDQQQRHGLVLPLPVFPKLVLPVLPKLTSLEISDYVNCVQEFRPEHLPILKTAIISYLNRRDIRGWFNPNVAFVGPQ